ncbi:MAG TPA: formate/nitrite transporter family protein [Papillibacter sp.]|nr:formate/nitrite transporter family protein [Papillibacter sp.]
MHSPKENAEYYLSVGETKAKLPAVKAIILGILAGMFIALASVASTIASSTISNGAVAKIISGLVFPGGLAMVLIAGSELFTGNTLLVIPLLARRFKVGQLLKNWVCVYIGNYIGSLIIALLVVNGGVISAFSNQVAISTITVAVGKVTLTGTSALFKGILCNFLVCIAVWMAYMAKDIPGKILGLFFPIMFFIISGFEHSVANMYYITAGLLARTNPIFLGAAQMANESLNVGALTVGNMLLKNLLPVTVGNMLGSIVFIALPYWFCYLRDSGKTTAAAGKSKK